MSYKAAQHKALGLFVKAGLSHEEAKELLHDAINEAKDLLVLKQYFKDAYEMYSEE